MTSRTRWLILGFALVGLAFASASSWVHYRLLTDPTYVSPCDVNATFNCTQAYLSRFGSIRGVPVALGGVIWFALVALVAGFSRPASKDSGDATGGYIFALATVGLAVVLYLGYASFFILKTACLLCMGTYASVLGIFAVSGLTTSTAMTRLPLRFWSDLRALSAKPTAVLVAILYLAGAASVVAFFPKEARLQSAATAPPPKDAQDAFEQAWAAQPRVDLGIPSAGAKVVIVKFNDWLCPACKATHYAYEPILDKYAKTMPGTVKYVVKDYPWNRDCNFNTPRTLPGHEGSCVAAAAVRMATDRGKGGDMIDWLFQNQERLDELGQRGGTAVADAIKAEATGLGVTEFDREYPVKVNDIRRDVADGGAVQVNMTPTYFVNGVRAVANSASLPPQYFEMAIQYEIKKATAGK